MILLNNGKYSVKYAFLELILAHFIVTRLISVSKLSVDLWNVSENHYYYWICSTFLIIFILHFSRLTSSYNFRDEFFIPKFKPIFIWQSFLIFVKILIWLFVPLIIVYLLLFYFFPEAFQFWEGEEAFKPKFVWNISSRRALFLMVITSLFAGGVEELFFRAFVITKLRQVGIASLIASFLSSVIFAYGHLYYGFIGCLVTFVAGGILSYIYLVYKNIYYSIFFHSFYNIFVSFLLFLSN
ncbi:CPBP family intramembrane glutamic endopeptidase [Borrelia sp. HM]|uniref:CPBP family intramembrane glutamic endopeptidase n=1 Tax=Borrelia sp. HM TaxID=1882662 RepID=UPI001C758D2C|nr:CPBP family intramembrane glutamic endopeptidase [Borrelia sp. HM]BCR22006.1 hypothetical protein BKFM_00587 [Borrelia sp. HM]